MLKTKLTDVSVKAAELYFLPVQMRIPLKFGPETVNSVTCARVRVTVANGSGKRAVGWGETPLSVQWVWPSRLPLEGRHTALKEFCLQLAQAWGRFAGSGHPMEIGHAFQEQVLPKLWATFNKSRPAAEQMPWLAALVCCSPFDIAVHDAFGVLNDLPIYQTYTNEFMTRNLSWYFGPEEKAAL